MVDRQPANGTAVELHDVSYRLVEGRLLLDRLSFTISHGETLVLLGRSGAGKTTALKLINGLIRPTSGHVLIQGRAQQEWDLIRLRRSVGYVIQGVGLFPHWSVEQNIAMVPRLENWDENRVAKRVKEMMSLVGLDFDEYAKRRPRELSGGQRQRVGVARALAADPPILLMDEPFGALDPVTRTELQREFRDLAGRLGKTIAFVTHDVREALLLANRIALMASGRLAGIYRPEEFLDSADAEARAFVESMDPALDRDRA